ncbi:hypothetical protein ACQ4LE_001335 [Meloidogyne hapla]
MHYFSFILFIISFYFVYSAKDNINIAEIMRKAQEEDNQKYGSLLAPQTFHSNILFIFLTFKMDINVEKSG